MAGKNPKNDKEELKKGGETKETSGRIDKAFASKVKDALGIFTQLTDQERKEKREKRGIFEDQAFLDQFFDYLKDEYPSIFDEIENKDKLTVYVEHLENEGFQLKKLAEDKTLQNFIKEKTPEKEVINQSIENLGKQRENLCKKNKKLPENGFEDFCKEIDCDTTPNIRINSTSYIRKITDLATEREDFIERNTIPLTENDKQTTKKILTPDYLPTERLLINAAIKKIEKTLPKGLKEEFKSYIGYPLDTFHPIQNLSDFASKRKKFLDINSNSINEDLAKKLDKIIVTNGDMYTELKQEGIDIKQTESFSAQEKDFRRIFNKLATRQLLNKMEESGKLVDAATESIADSFKAFPPYINKFFTENPTYKFNYSGIKDELPGATANMDRILGERKLLDAKMNDETTPEDEKQNLYKQIRASEIEFKEAKREAYIAWISSKDKELGSAIKTLKENSFNMQKIDKNQQQKIMDILVDSTIQDTIDKKVPELMDIDEAKRKKFVKDLFDLSKKEISFETPQGPISIPCLNKGFIGGPLNISLGEIDEYKKSAKLPFSVTLGLDDLSKDFFEENEIFRNFFTEFTDKNGVKSKITDSYRVRVTGPNGERKEGYLSSYPPFNTPEDETTEKIGENCLYMYSKPITRPEDASEREYVYRNENTPVVIKDSKQKNYGLEIRSRQLDLDGEAIGGLLFGHAVGQHSIKHNLSPKEEERIQKQFGALDESKRFLATQENTPLSEDITKINETIETKEKSDLRKFLESREKLEGYQTIEDEKTEEEKKNFGCKKGAKLIIPIGDKDGGSNIIKELGGKQYMTIEVTNIDEAAGKIKLKFRGGETNLGKREGYEETFPLKAESLQKISETFDGKKLKKLPPETDPGKLLSKLEASEISENPLKESFGNIKRTGKNFDFQGTDNAGKKVKYFSYFEKRDDEDLDAPMNRSVYVEYEYHPGKERPFEITIKNLLSPDENNRSEETTTMDETNFLLFVAGKKLQPQTEETHLAEEEAKGKVDAPKRKKRKPYSIGSILGMVKGIGKKISDGLKKYEEEQIEDVTDTLMGNGELFQSIANFIPFSKMKGALEGVADSYLAERDSKSWKKIEKRVKYYESDPDFGSQKIRGEKVLPYLKGEKELKDNYQAAGMFLATIKKGKGPYSRNMDWAGKGLWIRLLLGTEQQKIYLKMKKNLEEQLKQGAPLHGPIWAGNKQDEILKFETKFITDVVDKRWIITNESDNLQALYSKKFGQEVETYSNEFFNGARSKQEEVAKNVSFENARFDYFRLLSERPQQAVAYLKTMACKAVNTNQRKTFEGAVLTGMLSGVFYNLSSEDRGFIKKVCRGVGFIPGIRATDVDHHIKVKKFLDLASNGNFSKEYEYDSTKHGFGDLTEGISFATTNVKGKNFFYNKRYDKNATMINDFCNIIKPGADIKPGVKGKSVIDLINDPATSFEDKILLKEVEAKSKEVHEDSDNEVMANPYGITRNIMARGQSYIEDISGFEENGSFKGKDKDAIQNKQEARKEIANKIGEAANNGERNNVIYILEKFCNWFGIDSVKKELLIDTLNTIKKEKEDGNVIQGEREMIETIMFGSIISSRGQVPEELKNAIEKFVDFFQKNRDIILKPDVIEKGFGSSEFVRLLDKRKKIGPRKEYLGLVLNKSNIGLSNDEKIAKKNAQQRYSQGRKTYLNEKLYKMAQELEKKNGIENKIEGFYSNEEKKETTEQQLKKILIGEKNIAMKGGTHKLKHQIDRIKKGEVSGDPDDDEEDDLEDDNDTDYY